MAAELQRLGAADVLVLPNCSVRWQPRPGDARLLRDAIGVDASTPVAIYHGGLYRNRGIEAMLACVGRPGLEDVRFVFLGYGPLDSVIAAAAERDRRVHLLPAVPPAELCSWLSGADVGVAVCGDSANHAVTIPNKVFEWLMAGVPMVVSDFPAWRGIVRDDPGGPFGEAVESRRRRRDRGGAPPGPCRVPTRPRPPRPLPPGRHGALQLGRRFGRSAGALS